MSSDLHYLEQNTQTLNITSLAAYCALIMWLFLVAYIPSIPQSEKAQTERICERATKTEEEEANERASRV